MGHSINSVGDVMKKTFIGLAVLVLAAVQTFDAQTVNSKTREEEQSDDPGERLGKKIERFILDLTREFSRDEYYDVLDQDTLPSKAKRRSVDVDLEDDTKTKTYEGNTTVKRDRTIETDVVVKGGDLTVYGNIDGDVLVVGGTLYVKDGGKITGNARVINGDIVKEDGGIIEGYMDKANSTTASYRQDRRRFSRPSTSFDAPWLSESTNLENFKFRYNRVEGLFLGLGSEKKYYWDGRKSFTSFGSVGWGIRSHTWRGNLGIARQFALKSADGDEMLELGVEGYSLTDSKDQWLIGVNENTGAALLIHEDFRDYFERNGFSAHVAYYSQSDYFKTELKAAYSVDKYASLSNNTEWALFGGEKLFRPNPPVNDGSMRSVLASAGLTTVSKTSRGPGGWSIYGTFEYGPKTLGGDFDFDQYLLDIRRFQPVSSYDNLNARLRVGSSDGRLPIQKNYDLGGLGTLNAFPFKYETGNRMILMNAEYIVNGTFLDDLDFWPTWIFRNVNLLLFTDAGLVRTALQGSGPTEGFDKITWREFRHDLGAGFSNRSGSFRIGLSWRTDVKEPARFVLRFERPF
jgi:cytoskeletal protein CcmA (bactofilin family)